MGACRVAEAWAAQELSLPMHPDLSSLEIERVASSIESALSVRSA